MDDGGGWVVPGVVDEGGLEDGGGALVEVGGFDVGGEGLGDEDGGLDVGGGGLGDVVGGFSVVDWDVVDGGGGAGVVDDGGGAGVVVGRLVEGGSVVDGGAELEGSVVVCEGVSVLDGLSPLPDVVDMLVVVVTMTVLSPVGVGLVEAAAVEILGDGVEAGAVVTTGAVVVSDTVPVLDAAELLGSGEDSGEGSGEGSDVEGGRVEGAVEVVAVVFTSAAAALTGTSLDGRMFAVGTELLGKAELGDTSARRLLRTTLEAAEVAANDTLVPLNATNLVSHVPLPRRLRICFSRHTY